LDKGETAEFGDFFKGFDTIGQLALTALVMNLILIGSLVPFFLAISSSGLISWYMELMQNPTDFGDIPQIPSWSGLLILPAIYLGVAYSWAYKFVVFYKMSFWDALESSRKLITKKWGIFFLFMLVAGLIGAAGVILLCVGILATLPVVYCAVYASFADVTKLNEAGTDSSDNIEKHLVE
jgi:hypothetical protein